MAPEDDVRPFTVHVPDDDLDDLRDRLRRTRWPERETVDGWAQGVPLEYLQRLVTHWLDDYDWRATERRINRWHHARTTIDGLSIHFVHVRSPHPHATPVLLTHGWPGSFLEYGKLVAPLTDPLAHGGSADDAFDVVIASLPGYGFSDRPQVSGWGIERIAAAWAVLMQRLGYSRYIAAGSDWGTSISTVLAGADAEHVAAVHLVPPLAPPDPATVTDPTPWEQAALDDLRETADSGSAYSQVQRTRPQTIGYALVDSPVALCAWLAEKYHLWSDRSVATALSDDDVLDAVSLYWFTRTGASAARLYWESIDTVTRWFTDDAGPPITVPVGASVFAHETPRISQRWAANRFPDIRVWREHDSGGHFAALEAPDLLIDDLRALARLVR